MLAAAAGSRRQCDGTLGAALRHGDRPRFLVRSNTRSCRTPRPRRAAAGQRAGRGRHLSRDPPRHDRRRVDRHPARRRRRRGADRLVALAAWAASLAIPRTSAAAPAAPRAEPLRRDRSVTSRRRRSGAVPLDARDLVVLAAGAIYLSQFPGYVRFTLGGEEAVVTLFLTVFRSGSPRLAAVQPAPRRKVSARHRALGSARASGCSRSICGSPARLRAAPQGPPGWGPSSASPPLAYPRRLFGIAVSGGVFVVPLYALLAAVTSERSAAPRRSRQTT